ncbi:hypothetical protein SISSUDRAFT_1052764 [Sistotremastrum suecicum HHB10207 ss-3]|uniref:Uncharacterized protein n=1 Tax=Sistotremastrum suecicum HHB10207 ss-3 TaxID=1314776 RepID=A0A165ZMW8_9AGAM|nr:hypothetical protein SISSUDRAFT_1052764 [Sistotremastrum suecicum HHB10207 ss-3]
MSDLIISDALQAMIESEDIRNMARNPVKELMNLLYWSMLTCMIFMTLGLLLQLTIMSLEFDLAEYLLVPGTVVASCFAGVFIFVIVAPLIT